MSIRFTETDKWKDTWFRKLTPCGKLLWVYICENCDEAGFFDKDLELASFFVGVDIKRITTAFEELTSRLEIIEDKVWIRKFIQTQRNVPLNPFNNAHKKIIRIITDNPEFTDAMDLIDDSDDEYKRVCLSQKEAVWIRDCGICVYTKKKLKSLSEYELDHVFPRSKGGGDVYSNLACCYKGYNQEKRDKIVDMTVPDYSASKAKRELMSNKKLLAEFNSFFGRAVVVVDGRLKEKNNGYLGAELSPTGKGKGNSKGNVEYKAEFEEWWSEYNTGVKSKAFEAWEKQNLSKDDVTILIEATKQYKLYCKSIDRSFKDGQGWINGRYWETTWTHKAQGTKPVSNSNAVSKDLSNF